MDDAERGEKSNGTVILTTSAAIEVYENQFGKFSEVYYGIGPVFGIPFASALDDSLEKSQHIIDSLSFSFCCIRFSFFLPWGYQDDNGYKARLYRSWDTKTTCL